MSHIVDFFNERLGSAGAVAASFVCFALAVLGFVIAFRGRGAMVWLVSVCASVVGVLAGAMTGLHVFDSLIIMIAMAIAGGTIFLLLVRFVKSLGYFIGIGVLGFFIAFIVTSEMYTANTKVTEQTLLAIDMLAGIIVGLLSAIRSKYMVTIVTSAAGGMITSISLLALFGFYFTDWKTWLLAAAVAVAGMMVQIKVYDIKPPKKKPKPKRNKHEK